MKNFFIFIVLFFFDSSSVSWWAFIGSALFWLCVHWSLHIWNDYKGELLWKYRMHLWHFSVAKNRNILFSSSELFRYNRFNPFLSSTPRFPHYTVFSLCLVSATSSIWRSLIEKLTVNKMYKQASSRGIKNDIVLHCPGKGSSSVNHLVATCFEAAKLLIQCWLPVLKLSWRRTLFLFRTFILSSDDWPRSDPPWWLLLQRPVEHLRFHCCDGSTGGFRPHVSHVICFNSLH